MIADVHVHLGSMASVGRSLDAEGALRIADKMGVDRIFCTHLASLFYDTFSGDELLLRDLKRFPDRIWAYVTVSSPRHGQRMVDHVRTFIGDHGFHGLKIYSHPKGLGSPEPWLSITDPYMYPILETAVECRVPVLAHSTPAECDEVCRLFPELTLLMAHMGGTAIANGDWHTAISVARKHPNLYLDATSSCLDAGMIEEAVLHLGPTRVVWGSDIPLLDPWCQIEKIRHADLPDGQIEQILGLNIQRLISLKEA